MSDYAEIEDPKMLARLHRRLATNLNRQLRYSQDRTIGYPAGKFDAPVRFQHASGDDVFYWSPWASDDKATVGSFFGHGSPQSRSVLNIDVQFNLPAADFHRQSGGTFVRHTPTDTVVMAHRGIVTLGHGRVPKADLFREMTATAREVDTSDGIRSLLLIAELESQSLARDINAFALELRRTVRALNTGRTAPASHHSRKPSDLSGRLRQYFDEFAGHRKVPGRRASVADCYHGAVVRALRGAVTNPVDTLKSQAIDLTIVTRKRLYLFEVKTAAQPQHIYTAIGQLTAHAPAVANMAPKKELVKVMVLPELPNPRLRQLLERHLGIQWLLFTRDADGSIRFADLKTVVIS